MWRLLCLTASIGAATAWSNYLAASAPDPNRDVAFEQRLGATLPLQLVFFDESARRVRLGELLTGKPAVLVLGYYRCPNLCSTVMSALIETLQRTSLEAGRDFELVAVSIDPRETPAIAAEKKTAYLRAYDRAHSVESWHFLTGDATSIAGLAASVGFRARYDPGLDQYLHGAGIVVLTPTARVAHYFFGVDFPPKELRDALIDASGDQVGSFADRLFLLCSGPDGVPGRYTAAIMNVVKLAGLGTIVALVALLLPAFMRERRAPPNRNGRAIHDE